ncbi:LysR family transcriptional regulator, partial [Granulosicoccus sp.]|nr:LysR family transcriptional regulator [Granulosicoccus sp.]
MKRFAQVVETGSVTAAANILCVSQPAVTKSLKQLEDHFSVELLIRGKKGVAPTEHGETVYRLAKLMQQSMSDVASEIGTKKAREGKQLRIGAGLLWCYVYLPDALNSVIDQDPELGVEVVLRPPEELHNMVSDGRLDLAVGEMPEERHCGIVYENLLVSKNSIFA